jgi:hypothetical protein
VRNHQVEDELTDAQRRCHVSQGVALRKRAANGAPCLDGGAACAVGQGAARDQQAGEDLALPAHHPHHRHGHQRRMSNAGHLRALRHHRGIKRESAQPHNMY